MRVKCLGCSSNTRNFIKSWSQFADDTAIATAFIWADLIVKMSECVIYLVLKNYQQL